MEDDKKIKEINEINENEEISKKSENYLQELCESYLFRLTDNIERLLKEKNTNLNQLVSSSNIKYNAGGKHVLLNTIYNFQKKIAKYKEDKKAGKKDLPYPYLALTSIVMLAEYFGINVTTLIEGSNDKTISVPFYNNKTKYETYFEIPDNIFDIKDENNNKKPIMAVKVDDTSMAPYINKNDIVIATNYEQYMQDFIVDDFFYYKTDGLYIIETINNNGTHKGYFPRRVIFNNNNTADIICEDPAYKTITYHIDNDGELRDDYLLQLYRFTGEDIDRKEYIYIAGEVIAVLNKSIVNQI